MIIKLQDLLTEMLTVNFSNCWKLPLDLLTTIDAKVIYDSLKIVR